ncbi:2OG-Fe(II) oxygenase [Acidiphilium multivorum]|nr:2OG-Fe(II) oxygenase [Acidiphilium multivorum]
MSMNPPEGPANRTSNLADDDFMAILDLDAFRATPLTEAPFQYLVTPHFIAREQARAVLQDFPRIEVPGLLPLEATDPGPLFRALIDELTGREITAAVSEKFGVDLTGRPTMITLRGRARERDGRIHTDSEAKLITALLYFNEAWEAEGGRLRLLRGPDNLDDMLAEVPPLLGTLVMFRRSDRSFHGHEPFVGVRRYVMINWMTSSLTARRELMRHRLSAQAKRVLSHV